MDHAIYLLSRIQKYDNYAVYVMLGHSLYLVLAIS